MFSRRSFLAASAAAPLVLSSRAYAANDKLTLGFIGVGTMGRGHLGAFLGRKDVEVVAVCDVVKERLDNAVSMVEKRYADRKKEGSWKGVKAITDYRKLLEDKSIDAVVIATPDHWHAYNAVAAARAGKHIYCEKPLTHNIAEGRWIVDEVKKAKIAFQVGSQQRSEFGNRFRSAVEMIWNGWIGDIKTIRIGVGVPNKPCDLPTEEIPAGTDWDMWQGPAPERGYNSILCPKGVHSHFPQWRAYREYAGGLVADMGAHHFDIAQWALKMDNSGPVEVAPPSDPKKLSGLTFTYANGVKMIHNEFVNDQTKADCVFEGTEGTILVGRGQLEVRFKSGSKAGFPDSPKRVTPSNDHRANWLETIRAGKTECICTPEIGHRTATVCHLGNLGYQLRRPLKWDPVKEEFANDDEANKLRSRTPREKWKV